MTPAAIAISGAFEADACDRIVALARSAPESPGPVYDKVGGTVDRSRRDVAATLHERGPLNAWLFDRLDALFAAAAEKLGLPVGPISEPIQILRYDVGSHFAMWHTDAGRDATDRRCLSMSVELSDPGDHEGGALEIVPDTVGRPRILPRGAAIVFPSRALHRVTPVTRGRRWALVAWTGPL